MRGIDTNVLARAFGLEDDPAQVEAAQAFLSDCRARGEVINVDTLVLVELVWLLRSKQYRFPRAAIADFLDELLDSDVVTVAERALVRRAIAAYRHGQADFFDYLLGHRNEGAGCTDTVTFDQALAGVPGFTVLRARE